MVLWMVAKSPVENGGLSHYVQGFNHPFGGAGFRWPIRRISKSTGSSSSLWTFWGVLFSDTPMATMAHIMLSPTVARKPWVKLEILDLIFTWFFYFMSPLLYFFPLGKRIITHVNLAFDSSRSLVSSPRPNQDALPTTCPWETRHHD